MAEIREVRLVDDIDGSEATDTILFDIDNRGPFEIDLSDDHINKLRGDLAPFIAAARRADTAQRRGSGTSSGSKRSRDDLAQVRAWAAEHGASVSERGRIARNVLAAYDAKDPSLLGVTNTPTDKQDGAVIEFKSAG
ncbi:MAG TPA: Lsr2 family protein [Propionibacteriaceae bacterium]|nr:Lsr2 family protein [Propionibacteriaceae bacterium]